MNPSLLSTTVEEQEQQEKKDIYNESRNLEEKKESFIPTQDAIEEQIEPKLGYESKRAYLKLDNWSLMGYFNDLIALKLKPYEYYERIIESRENVFVMKEIYIPGGMEKIFNRFPFYMGQNQQRHTHEKMIKENMDKKKNRIHEVKILKGNGTMKLHHVHMGRKILTKIPITSDSRILIMDENYYSIYHYKEPIYLVLTEFICNI
jgi:hypothetical protein